MTRDGRSQSVVGALVNLGSNSSRAKFRCWRFDLPRAVKDIGNNRIDEFACAFMRIVACKNIGQRGDL